MTLTKPQRSGLSLFEKHGTISFGSCPNRWKQWWYPADGDAVLMPRRTSESLIDKGLLEPCPEAESYGCRYRLSSDGRSAIATRTSLFPTDHA